MATYTKLFDKLFTLLRLERKEIGAIYFYAILGGMLQLSLPLGIQSIIGFVMGATMVTSVYVLIVLIVAGVLLVGALQVNQMKIIEKIQQKIFVRFALEFAEKIPNLDLKETDKYYLPEKTNRFFDTQNIQKGLSKILLDIPGNSIQILFGLMLLSLYHPLFIIFSLVLLAIMLAIFRLTGKLGLQTSVAESDHKYSVVAWLEEMSRVIKSFKYSQGSNLNLIKTDQRLEKYIEARTSHFKVLLFQFKSIIFFKVSITALMLGIGTYLLFEQKINVGQFVASEIVILAMMSSLEKLIVSLEYVYDVLTGLTKIHSVIDLPNEGDGTVTLPSQPIQINISNLSFGYNENEKVIQNINMQIAANTITCISGKENSGKSTLLKLLTGSYRNFEGSIILNHLPIQNYTLKSLRENTGVILSEQEIFSGTLYENISLGKNHITTHQIMELAKQLYIENFIYQLPLSFDTVLNPQGNQLPTSTVRKILLLRALIHHPPLLILEEPWQGMDFSTTQAIQKYLFEISKHRTIIIATTDSQFASLCSLQIDLTNIKNERV